MNSRLFPLWYVRGFLKASNHRASPKTLASIRNASGEDLSDLLLSVPNVLLDPSPEVRTVRQKGEKYVGRFGFRSLTRSLMSKRFRWFALKGALARLHRTLTFWLLDLHTAWGEEWILPNVCEEKDLLGCGQLPKMRDGLFEVGDGGWLIPTGETSLLGWCRDSLLVRSSLPIKRFTGSWCFRREVGAAGATTPGILRSKQFEKVELVVIEDPDRAFFDALEDLLGQVLLPLDLLNMTYRVIALPDFDTPFSASYTLDVEVWMPSLDRWIEISSVSYCGTWQAARLGLKLKGEKAYPATLNASALAIGRLTMALIELCTDEEGWFTVPSVLSPYFSSQRFRIED